MTDEDLRKAYFEASENSEKTLLAIEELRKALDSYFLEQINVEEIWRKCNE